MVEVTKLSSARYRQTVLWTLVAVATTMVIAGGVARASLNWETALTDNPDVAIFQLLPEAGIHKVTLLREEGIQRDYLAETATGDMLVRLRKNESDVWAVILTENLRP